MTVSLDLKFISAVMLGQELFGRTKIQKKTKSMVFLTCELTANNKIVATASGVWKILKLPGAGTAAHRSADQNPCVTISLELKFISAVKLGQELIGKTKIQKKTKSMVFLTCELTASNKIVATASGVWKILKLSGAGPGG